ncbi:MAG: U32 family peptidase [Chitinophagales bacterium]|nr:U32 family peptidase [Chitinophagales bacterium]
MKRPELLAPVGSFESLHAAIRGGADAIYFGVEQLNMRTKSVPTITVEDIAEVAEVCHNNGIKAYLTLNTVMYDHDMQLAGRIIKACKTAGIDAIIASDYAIFGMCQAQGMPLHISTQANVSNIESVSFFASMADVIVLSRELTVKQVAHIVAEVARRNIRGISGQLMKIEAFVHGALCMAVSGKCYMSLHEKNASANRGACVQNCRRPYKVTDLETGNEMVIDNEYIMSPKDLCTIDFMDQMIEAGIDVFKIEGRSKSAEYVYATTKCYREAIDAVLDGSYNQDRVAIWMEELEKVYNRGFWGGYFMGKKLGEWSQIPGSIATEKKVYIARCSKYYPKIQVAEFTIESGQLKAGDPLLVLGRNTGSDKLNLTALVVNGEPAEVAIKGDKITFPFENALRPGDKLYKLVSENA